jgi:UDP-N-acetylglucosamine--N-acetylmuramyl-(pentapeptide) pyrophosphoryl-undecaprenol N-acetylglucosamine transferase
METKKMKFIVSGGGTGGHIFPAISIANALKKKCPDADILFVGAEGRMEMEKVPQAGYDIKGLPICGLDRKNPLKNFKVIYKLLKCISMAKKIVKDFAPDAVVGVGRICQRSHTVCCQQAGYSYLPAGAELLCRKG